MYADTGVFFPYMQNFGQDMQQLEVYCKSQKPNFSMSNLVQASTIAEYDLGAEGDLFKAPEPIIEEPGVGLDSMAAAMSIIPCSEDAIASQVLKAVDIESIQNEQLWREVLYECEKDLMATAAIETPLSEVLDIKIPVAKNDENQNEENKVIPDVAFQKSVSSSCLSSMDWMQGPAMKPNFLDFPGMDFAAYGMRRAYSEGDIKTLGNDNMSLIPSCVRQLVISSCCAEDRKEKLSRYRNKKKKRNFGRKIKYACRKALADSQPRIRGRFAKTEESDTSKRQLLD